MATSRSVSFDSLDSELSPLTHRTLQEEVNDIRLSLDLVRSRLLSQQILVSREFEDRIRNVYDSVINDINEVRKHVNTIGENVAATNKYKTWFPAAPFRKNILRNAYELQQPVTKLKTSKSVDFVDSRGIGKHRSDCPTSNVNRGRLSSSSTSIEQKSGSRSQLPGYGCCFHGDNKTIPYRSHGVRHGFPRNFRHSWGPSRFGSRSTLDDDDSVDLDPGKGCMCGEVTDDWRVKVAPHMWEGWPMPGLELSDVEKLRDRFESMYTGLQFEKFRQEAVVVHSEYRRHHGCPELHFSEDLSRDAQLWAESIAIKGYAQYSELSNRGENILVVDIEDELCGRQVVDTWYREHRLYNYRQPRWQRGTSNFTQMIWRDSRYIGVGIAKYPYQDTYVIVAQYQPPGNVNTPHQYTRNVPMPLPQTGRDPEQAGEFRMSSEKAHKDLKDCCNTQSDQTATGTESSNVLKQCNAELDNVINDKGKGEKERAEERLQGKFGNRTTATFETIDDNKELFYEIEHNTPLEDTVLDRPTRYLPCSASSVGVVGSFEPKVEDNVKFKRERMRRGEGDLVYSHVVVTERENTYVNIEDVHRDGAN